MSAFRTVLHLFGVLAVAGCGGSQPPIGAPGAMPAEPCGRARHTVQQHKRPPIVLIGIAGGLAVGFALGFYVTTMARNPNEIKTLAFPLGFGGLLFLYAIYVTRDKFR